MRTRAVATRVMKAFCARSVPKGNVTSVVDASPATCIDADSSCRPPFRNRSGAKDCVRCYLRHADPPPGAWGLSRSRCYAPPMATYNVLAAGTVLWLLASAGSTDSQLPLVLTATLTGGLLVFIRI